LRRTGIAVRNEPENGDFHLKLAAALRSNQQWPNFVQEAIRASDLLPNNREAQLLAIEGMNRTQRFDDALDRLTPIIKATPDDPRVLTLFGNTKAHMLSETYGVQEISEAWRKGAYVEGVQLKLRRPTTKAEDTEAEAAFRKALAIDPRLYAARMSLMGFLWANDRMDEGADMLKAAADETPAHAFLSRTLGLFYEQRGQFGDAEKYLKIACRRQRPRFLSDLVRLLQASRPVGRESGGACARHGCGPGFRSDDPCCRPRARQR
jgi:tetratricopeptide (TPR) repeat protein